METTEGDARKTTTAWAWPDFSGDTCVSGQVCKVMGLTALKAAVDAKIGTARDGGTAPTEALLALETANYEYAESGDTKL